MSTNSNISDCFVPANDTILYQLNVSCSISGLSEKLGKNLKEGNGYQWMTQQMLHLPFFAFIEIMYDEW